MSHLARFAFIATLLAAATPLPASAEDAVRLGNLKFAHYGAVSYVKEIAKDCGITVEERIFAKGPDVMQAILAGEIDVGATASEAAISGRAAGAPIYVVAGFASGGARLVAGKDSGIKGLADLKGKAVGVTRGGIQEVLLAAELAKAGLTWSEQPGKDVRIVYLAFADLNQALLQKQLDAIMQSEPQGAQAVAAGYGVEILRPYDTPIGTPIRTLVMSEAFHDGKHDVALKFMRCFLKATALFQKDPDLAQRYVSDTMFKGQLTAEDFKSAMGNAAYTSDITADHIQRTIDTMAAYKIGKMAAPPKAADFVKLDLVEEARQP
jgi:NitT/TauT family transport system substrate-binding protein